MNFSALFSILFLLPCVSACIPGPTKYLKTTTTPSTTACINGCDETTATTQPTTQPTTQQPTKIQCPSGWIDGQSLGCVKFLNEVSLSWFQAYDVCQEKYSGSLVEALKTEEAEFLFQVAEVIQLSSSNETWGIGLTDFFGRYLAI